jgi:hypothetical protein
VIFSALCKTERGIEMKTTNKHTKHAILFSIAVLCMVMYSNSIFANAILYTEADFPNVPVGACFSYSVEFTDRDTHEQISLSENFACKALLINGSGVVVTQRWNMTGFATNDSIYSHYYISAANIVTLAGMFTPESKTYGGIEFMAINATSGVPMVDLGGCEWYIYDQVTGLALEGYNDDPGAGNIVHSWLTYYSATCNLGHGGDDVPGYDLFIIGAISILGVLVVMKHLRKSTQIA